MKIIYKMQSFKNFVKYSWTKLLHIGILNMIYHLVI